MNERNTLLYKNLSLSLILFSKGAQFVVSLRERWRDIYLETGTSSCPISSSWSQGVPTLAPPCKPYRQRRPNSSDQLCIPRSTLDSDWTLNLTAWFSYHVVPFRLLTCSTGLPRRTAIPLFTNHNVTACQSTWDHLERTQNSCQQSLYNTFSPDLLQKCFFIIQNNL